MLLMFRYSVKNINKNIFGLSLLVLIFSIIIGIFWYKDAQYALPTAKPANFKTVEINTVISVDDKLLSVEKPSYFHFFQPSCPCSRFNLKHYESLHRKYSKDFNFYCVIPPNSDLAWTKDLVEISDIKIIIDHNKRLANKCGVYSTPQAVILKTDASIYYKGNYNKGRYCTVKSSNYAETALMALQQGKSLPKMGHFALIPYGCEYNKKD